MVVSKFMVLVKRVKRQIWQYFVRFSLKVQILRTSALFNRKLAMFLKMCISSLILLKKTMSNINRIEAHSLKRHSDGSAS